MADAPTPPPSGLDAKKQAKADLAAAKVRAKSERPLWKKPLFWVAAVIVLFIVAGIAGSGEEPVDTAADSTESVVSDDSGTTTEEPAEDEEPDEEEEEPAEPEEPELTSGQEQAIRSAEDYLDYTAFSRSGLIEQLEYSGFSTKNATFAVDYLNVDWKKQAVKSAEDYLDYTSFSLSGLIEQLEYSGFTREQAEYGAKKAY